MRFSFLLWLSEVGFDVRFREGVAGLRLVSAPWYRSRIEGAPLSPILAGQGWACVKSFHPNTLDALKVTVVERKNPHGNLYGQA